MDNVLPAAKEYALDLFLPVREQAHNWLMLAYLSWSVFVLIDINGILSGLLEYMPVIYGAILSFLGIYATSAYLCNIYVPIYSGLSLFGQRQWDMRIMSSIHAVVVTVGGAVAFFDSDLHESPIETNSVVVKFVTSIFHGYSIFDSFLTIKYFDGNTPGGTAILIHHAMVVFISLFPLNTDKWGLPTSIYLMNEASTIFLNNIHFFKDLGIEKDGKLATYNSLTFAGVFFVFRIIGNTYIVVVLSLAGASAFGSTLELISCGGFAVAILALNLFWFYRIVHGALKVFRGPHDSLQTALTDELDLELGAKVSSDESDVNLENEHDGWDEPDDENDLLDEQNLHN
ncbi:hypothetical protein SARC_10577 [Sphaeroforma arctica JP610]|uniref:TLC domain-containing protein n=1 Tax=Sphaeroforma arctica JP610 TaxID=667725 RepID=A0A0L0FJI5_9EUKA|nr:hypothetical protein SARC_10577 [Sphaeroforma arctica JP610]KNC76949.1 hypothetical protein SARC_10577 [Sphaeroforma arctica JP610]|eukprot:XP_014150851.1 hypothetical protein SARC_10577 [Sphaeroforma arctica JP610]